VVAVMMMAEMMMLVRDMLVVFMLFSDGEAMSSGV